jgi:hypothetical protein
MSFYDLSPTNDLIKDFSNIVDNDREDEAIEFAQNIEKLFFSKKFKTRSSSDLNCFMYACKRDQKNLALYLVKTQKIDLEQVDNFGNTSLIWAIRDDFEEVVAELLKYDCLPHHANQAGETALTISCKNYDINMIDMLINCKKDINEFQIDRETDFDKANYAFDFLLTGEYAEHIENPKFIKAIKWFISKYTPVSRDSDINDPDSYASVLNRNIDRICQDEVLLSKMTAEFRKKCSPRSTVAASITATPIDVEGQRGPRPRTVARNVPIVRVEREDFIPGRPPDVYVPAHVYERDAIRLPKPNFGPGPGGKRSTKKNKRK